MAAIKSQMLNHMDREEEEEEEEEKPWAFPSACLRLSDAGFN